MTEKTNPDFPSEPLLRLNAEGHVAGIRRIDVDAAGRTLVSGSDDKTIKVWRLADGTLERTLRLPQGAGHLGKVFAVAISPDGSEVATGGWTGSAAGLGHTIYIFDRATGALKHRIVSMPNVINHLAYAPDGHRLVATLGGANGIRMYETTGYNEINRDGDYDNDSYWADFATDGRLVTTSFDGRLRLYRPDGTLAKTIQTPGGEHPYGVAFSPDGRRIAVGYDDSTQVEVLDGRTLKRLYAADNSDANNGSLGSVAWSTDGATLLAAGSYEDEVWTPIRRWTDAGRGGYNELLAATDTVMALRPLAGGRLAVGAHDIIAVLDPSGDSIWSQPNAAADFRGQIHDQGIRLSFAGDAVAFGYEQWGERPALFSLRDTILTLDPQDLDHLGLPDEGSGDGLAVTDWEDSDQPKLNDRPLKLDEFEFSRSLAIAPGGECLVLGAEYTLRAFNRPRDELWCQAVPSVVWAVNISRDGRYVVAGYGDGTLRWHRLEDGQEVLAFYPHPDGKRWVFWTPQGYYQASAGGEDLIGWHANRKGDLKAPDFFGVSRFRDHFYRPDVIARVLETGDPDEALRLADAEHGTETQTRSVAESLPPTIAILSPAPGTTMDSQRLVLLYQATSQDSPITNIEARSDGRPADELDHLQPSVSDDGLEVVGQITLAIPPQDGIVELIAHNANGAGEPATFVLNWGGAVDFYKPSLYVLAVGVSAYPSDALKLKFAARDAEDFVEVLKVQQGGLYKEVQTRLLLDAQATRDAIREGFNWLRRNVGQRDVAVVFLSGQGINEDGNYYYICVDANPIDLIFTALGDDDIRNFLSKVTGKTVLLLDTCYSGSLSPGKGELDSLPDIDKFANELADAENGVVVYSSSTGKEKSLEDEQWGHGAFTYALLEAVRDGKADFTDNGHVTIDELGLYLNDCVTRLTAGRQHPTVTKPQGVRNYAMFRVREIHYKRRKARDREEWLTQIDEAASARNQDQLRNLLRAAETERVSDRVILRALLNAYFDLRDLQGLMETFERFKAEVGQDPEALTHYAWALVRTGQSERAIVVLEEARTRGIAGVEITGLLARAYKNQWRERTEQGDLTCAEESLRHAAATYVEAFKNHPDSVYLGLNAVELLHLIGDEGSVSLRDELLPTVQSAAKQYVIEHDDYWAMASLLNLAVVRESQAEAVQLAEELRLRARESWEIETTVQNLRLLSRAKGFGEVPPKWIHDLAESLSEERR